MARVVRKRIPRFALAVIRTRLALAVIRTRRAQAPVDLPLTTQTLARVEYEEGGWCVLA